MPSDLDLILGGSQSAVQAQAPYERRRQDQLDQAQPLSDFEKTLGSDLMQRVQPLLAAGRDPRELATRIKLGLPLEDGQPPSQGVPSIPQQPPTMLQAQSPSLGPSYGYTPGMASPAPAQAPQAVPIPMPSQSQAMDRGFAAYPSAGPGPQALHRPGPQTQGDMKSLMGAAPFLRAQPTDNPDARMERLLLTLASREDIAGKTDETKRRAQDIRGNVAAAKLTESARQADARLELGYAALENRLQAVRTRISAMDNSKRLTRDEQLKLADIKVRAAALERKRSNVTSLMNGAGTFGAPGAAEAIRDLNSEIDDESSKLEADLAEISGRALKASKASGSPASEAPTLKTTATVKEPGGGAAPTPTGIFKTDAQGVKWEKMSDGTARKVK